jgi:hypothetical protein
LFVIESEQFGLAWLFNMTRTDFSAQFLVAASTALVTAIINLVVPGQISWLWLVPAFVVPFGVLFIYQGTGLGFKPYKEWRIRAGELIAKGGIQKGDVWEFERGSPGQGLGFHGPAIALPRGKYRVLFRLKLDNRDERDEPVCELGVTSNSGQKWFALRTISIRDFKRSDHWQEFPLDFSMSNDESRVEFRGHMEGVETARRRITFDKVRVYRRLL